MGTRVWSLVHPAANIATACVAGQEGSHATYENQGQSLNYPGDFSLRSDDKMGVFPFIAKSLTVKNKR